MNSKAPNYKKLIGGLAGVILAIVIARSAPQNPQCEFHIFSGHLCLPVLWWLVEQYLIMHLSANVYFWAILKVVPFSTAFCRIWRRDLWLLVGTLGMGLGVPSLVYGWWPSR